MLSRVEPGALGSIAVLCLLISGLGFGGYTVLQQIQRVELTPVDQAPGVIAQLDPLADATNQSSGEDFAASGGGVSADEALNRLYRPQPLEVPVLVARDGPISTLQPGALGALADSAPQMPRLASVAPTSPVVPEGTAPTPSGVQVVDNSFPEVAIAAMRPAWVRVTGADGAVLFEKILDAGESFDLPATEEPATLRAGNSGAVYFVVNGTAYGPAAPGAAVVKDIQLSAAALKTDFAPVGTEQQDVSTMVAELRLKWQDDAAQ